MRVKFLAECKKNPEKRENYCFGQICRKFKHFPSVKFPGLKMCKKNDKYQVCKYGQTLKVPQSTGPPFQEDLD